MPYLTLPYHTITYHTLPYLTLPYLNLSHLTLPVVYGSLGYTLQNRVSTLCLDNLYPIVCIPDTAPDQLGARLLQGHVTWVPMATVRPNAKLRLNFAKCTQVTHILLGISSQTLNSRSGCTMLTIPCTLVKSGVTAPPEGYLDTRSR